MASHRLIDGMCISMSLVCRANALRSMALDIHDNQEQTEGRFFVTQVGQLQRLELEHPALSLAARMFVHSMQLRVTQGMHTPVKLEWLRENRQLQHLSAALIQTGEVSVLQTQLPHQEVTGFANTWRLNACVPSL